jgi:hypothetical protein
MMTQIVRGTALQRVGVTESGFVLGLGWRVSSLHDMCLLRLSLVASMLGQASREYWGRGAVLLQAFVIQRLWIE